MSRGRLGILLSLLFATATLSGLATRVPMDAFFVGDQGVKLVATRNAVAHPFRPFEIDAPVVGGIPMPDLMDPFYAPHGDHAHAATSMLFPLMNAPFYATFGLRGLALLPLAGFVGMITGLVLTARRLEGGTGGASIVWLALLTSPLLFYSFEFWEHAPAAGMVCLATALVVDATRTPVRLLASGILLGAAIAVRPEAACYAVALWLAGRTLPRPLRLAEVTTCAGGIGVVLLPLVGYNLFHLGTISGPHGASNTPAFDSGWLGVRWALVRKWVWPSDGLEASLLAGAIVAGLIRRRHRSGDRLRQLVVLAAGAWLALLAARRSFPLESLWAAFPAALVLFAPTTPSLARTFVTRLVALDVALVVALAPNDGGGQWGPRYLLLAAGPAVLGMWQVLRETWRSHRLIERVLVIVLLGASGAVGRQSFKELRSIKQSGLKLQRAVSQAVHQGPVLTDIWWLDQVAGTSGPPPAFLFTPADKATAAVTRLRAVHVPSFAVVTTSAPDSEGRIAASWLAGTTFRLGPRQTLDDFGMTVYAITRAEEGVEPER